MKRMLILTILLIELTFSSENSFTQGGDKVISFPIILTKTNSNEHYFLTFWYDRNVRTLFFPRYWNVHQQNGPEGRVIKNNNHDSVLLEPDKLIVDFFFAENKDKYLLVNMPDSLWNNYPSSDGKRFEKGDPAFELFGAGGCKYGYSVKLDEFGININKGAVYNVYDIGLDENFTMVYLPLPNNLFINNADTINFRFRFRVSARKNRLCDKCIPDDDDVFVIDNIKLHKFKKGKAEKDCAIVSRLVHRLPYTMIPIRQANKIPIEMEIYNTTANPLTNLNILLKIKNSDLEGWPNYYIYKTEPNEYYTCYLENITLQAFEKKIVKFEPLNLTIYEDYLPETNAKNFINKVHLKKNKYSALYNIYNGYQLVLTDTIKNAFQFYLGNNFSYEIEPEAPHNDSPDYFISDLHDLGISVPAYSSGEYTEETACGCYYCDDTNGQIAMKFEIFSTDTLYGYAVFQAQRNTSNSDFSYCLYFNDTNDLPGELVPESTLHSSFYVDDLKECQYNNCYKTSLLKKPLVLEPGVYWMAIKRNDFCLIGASGRNTGMRIMNVDDGEIKGKGNVTLFIQREFLELDGNGNYKNRNLFAYNNTSKRSDWVSFSPTIGNPGYAFLDYKGTTLADSITPTYSRGTYVPMIRPYFSDKLITNVKDNTKYFKQMNKCYPNPASDYILLSFSNEKDDIMKIIITDFSGKEQFTSKEKLYEAGNNYETISIKDFPSGIYFYRIIGRTFLETGKFIKLN